MNGLPDSTKTAMAMRDGILALLGAVEKDTQVPPLPESTRSVLEFVMALKSAQPAEELMKHFRRIARPGLFMVSAMVNRLLAAGLTDPAAELLDGLDIEQMTPRNKVAYAEILAHRGRFETAETLIAEAYGADNTLKDAHARIAWKIFWPRKEYDKAIEWMNKDLHPSRDSCPAEVVRRSPDNG